jgi:DNA-binding transcriptional ArsR family regulator
MTERIGARATAAHRVSAAQRRSPPPFDADERRAQVEALAAKRVAFRKRVLDLLADGAERYSVEIAKQLGVPYRGVTAHLSQLAKAGVLTSRHVSAVEIHGVKSGLGRRYYKLARPA